MRERLTQTESLPLATGAKAGQKLNKTQALSLVAGKDFAEWSPEDFQIDAPIRLGAGKGFSYGFVLMADAQICDRGFSYGSRMSHFADKNPLRPIEATQRNFYQDHGDAIYFGYVLKAMRQAMISNTNLDFAIHLGDALQLGRQSELAVFNELVGKFMLNDSAKDWAANWTGSWLRTSVKLPGRNAPFLNLLGNHDVMFLGNFNKRAPIRIPPDAVHCQESLAKLLRGTAPFAITGRRAVLGEDFKQCGYYSLDRTMPDGKVVRLIVLNTNERNILAPAIPNMQCGTLFPSISGEQANWLRNLLNESDNDSSIGCVLVFGHNQIAELTINETGKRSDRDATIGRVAAMLAQSQKVAAYYCGHMHPGCAPVKHSINGRTLREFVLPSLQDFPKCFAIARLEKSPAGRYEPSIEFFNIEDCLNFAGIPQINVADAKVCSQQKRFTDWVRGLNALELPTVDRFKLVARAVYEGARYDLAHDKRNGIRVTFHPKFSDQLETTYHAGTRIWQMLRASAGWSTLRREYSTQPPEAIATELKNAR